MIDIPEGAVAGHVGAAGYPRTLTLTAPASHRTIVLAGPRHNERLMATYVLIPGAGGDAWYWHRVVPELEARGHDVVAVDLPAADEFGGLEGIRRRDRARRSATEPT